MKDILKLDGNNYALRPSILKYLVIFLFLFGMAWWFEITTKWFPEEAFFGLGAFFNNGIGIYATYAIFVCTLVVFFIKLYEYLTLGSAVKLKITDTEIYITYERGKIMKIPYTSISAVPLNPKQSKRWIVQIIQNGHEGFLGKFGDILWGANVLLLYTKNSEQGTKIVNEISKRLI